MAHLSVVSRMECPVSCVILLIFCSTILPAAVGTEVVGGSVEGVVGGDLVLPCSLKPSTSAVDEEVQWLIGDQVVHHYKQHQDIETQQLPAYRGRTRLDRDELLKGILSLEISSLRRSDANTYRCYISAQTGVYEASVHVTPKDAVVVGVAGEDLVLPCSIKPTSVAEKNMEVTWYRGADVVHLYKNQQDKLDQQHPDYKGRTTLFGLQELQGGNASLKISSLRPSDVDKYTCQIRGQSETIDTQYVQVEAVGSTPVITPVSLRNGSVDLTCESTGWTYEPQVEWRDSRGQSLSAEPTTFQKFPEGYRVVRRLRVEKRNGTSFTCRVWTQRHIKEEKVTVQEELFIPAGLSAGAIVGIVFGFIAAIIIICFLTPWGRLWHWGNSVVCRHKIPQDLECSTRSNSIHLEWRVKKYPFCSACGTCGLSPPCKFKVTYQEKGTKGKPEVIPESACILVDKDSLKWSAEIPGLKPKTRYTVKVCAVCEGKGWNYPSVSCNLKTNKGEDEVSTAPEPEARGQNGAPHDPET